MSETSVVNQFEAAEKKGEKNPIDSQRNMFIRVQALRWLEKNRNDVFEAIKELANKKYPTKGPRKRIALADELSALK